LFYILVYDSFFVGLYIRCHPDRHTIGCVRFYLRWHSAVFGCDCALLFASPKDVKALSLLQIVVARTPEIVGNVGVLILLGPPYQPPLLHL